MIYFINFILKLIMLILLSIILFVDLNDRIFFMYIGLFLIVERIDHKLSKRIIMKKILYFIWAILFISYFVIEYILIKNNFIDNTNIFYQIVPIIVISIRMYVEIYEKKEKKGTGTFF